MTQPDMGDHGAPSEKSPRQPRASTRSPAQAQPAPRDASSTAGIADTSTAHSENRAQGKKRPTVEEAYNNGSRKRPNVGPRSSTSVPGGILQPALPRNSSHPATTSAGTRVPEPETKIMSLKKRPQPTGAKRQWKKLAVAARPIPRRPASPTFDPPWPHDHRIKRKLCVAPYSIQAHLYRIGTIDLKEALAMSRDFAPFGEFGFERTYRDLFSSTAPVSATPTRTGDVPPTKVGDGPAGATAADPRTQTIEERTSLEAEIANLDQAIGILNDTRARLAAQMSHISLQITPTPHPNTRDPHDTHRSFTPSGWQAILNAAPKPASHSPKSADLASDLHNMDVAIANTVQRRDRIRGETAKEHMSYIIERHMSAREAKRKQLVQAEQKEEQLKIDGVERGQDDEDDLYD